MKRRDFIKRSVEVGAILPIASSGLFARPLAHSFYKNLSAADGRVLVLINLNGGNDGLNTIVPFEDPVYYAARPVLGIDGSELLPLSESLGFHPSMGGMANLFADDQLAVINNVGYDEHNRSHFRSTDIWHTSSDQDEILFTGWLGRYLQHIHPEYPTTLPSAPYALQISSSTTLALLSERGNMGIALENPERFYRLANGLDVEPTPLPSTQAGPELEYVRSVIAQSDSFARSINDAMNSGVNNATYMTDMLSQQLQLVGRLINGGLTTSVFVVTLGGFDTHSTQLASHALLLSYLSTAVASFLDDMQQAGNGDRVVMASYSEFGRRLNENGSFGTDHGAAAPQFVMGAPVRGGQVIGGNPDLVNLDNRGDLLHTIDYRSIYASLLHGWLGLSLPDTDTLLGGAFPQLPLFSTSSADNRRVAGGDVLSLERAVPDPAPVETTIPFTLRKGSNISLVVTSVDGRRVHESAEIYYGEGRHGMRVETRGWPAGKYLYTVRADGFAVTKSLTVAR